MKRRLISADGRFAQQRVLLLALACVIFSERGIAAGLGDPDAALKAIASAARNGDFAELDRLKEIHDTKAGDAVAAMITDKRVPEEAKLRIARIVSLWPAVGGLDYFANYLRRYPRPDEDMLRLFAEMGNPQFKPMFLGMIAPTPGRTMQPIKEPARFALAVRALGRFQDHSEGAVNYMGSLLAAMHPHVIRASAAEALGGIKHRQALAALLAWPKDAAIGLAVQRSLFRLTGEDFGDDLEKWNAWAADHGGPDVLKMLTAENWEEHAKVKAAFPPDPDQTGATSFYGLQVTGRRLVFILDTSGSMSGSSLETLKAQMGNLLSSLQGASPGMHYAILTFDDNVQSCAPGSGLMKNDDASFSKATRFVERMRADGGTSMVSALKHVAAQVLPSGNVDTIYFLSDGMPSDGTPDDVMNLVTKIHQQHRVWIHTVSINMPVEPPAAGSEPALSLLERMARATGGTYLAK